MTRSIFITILLGALMAGCVQPQQEVALPMNTAANQENAWTSLGRRLKTLLSNKIKVYRESIKSYSRHHILQELHEQEAVAREILPLVESAASGKASDEDLLRIATLIDMAIHNPRGVFSSYTLLANMRAVKRARDHVLAVRKSAGLPSFAGIAERRKNAAAERVAELRQYGLPPGIPMGTPMKEALEIMKAVIGYEKTGYLSDNSTGYELYRTRHSRLAIDSWGKKKDRAQTYRIFEYGHGARGLTDQVVRAAYLFLENEERNMILRETLITRVPTNEKVCDYFFEEVAKKYRTMEEATRRSLAASQDVPTNARVLAVVDDDGALILVIGMRKNSQTCQVTVAKYDKDFLSLLAAIKKRIRTDADRETEEIKKKLDIDL